MPWFKTRYTVSNFRVKYLAVDSTLFLTILLHPAVTSVVSYKLSLNYIIYVSHLFLLDSYLTAFKMMVHLAWKYYCCWLCFPKSATKLFPIMQDLPTMWHSSHRYLWCLLTCLGLWELSDAVWPPKLGHKRW